MTIGIKTAKTLFGFEPKLHYYEAEYYLGGQGLSGTQLKNSELYNLVRKLAELAHPSQQDEYDKRWFYFYLPLRRSGRVIAIPFWIVEYKKLFTVGFHLMGSLNVDPGKEEIGEWYAKAFKEALRFAIVIKKTKNEIISKTLPYDFRTGKIKGKYVLQKLMPAKEAQRLEEKYGEHVKQQLLIPELSLEDYLNTAAICYCAAYGKKTNGLTPEQIYWRWADKRHGGMLDVKGRQSKEEFAKWLESGVWAGSHPFEIVFSWHGHGIHLYPPSKDKPHYSLRVTNYAYASDFIKMAERLICSNISFEALGLKEVLAYLTGETQFAVNEYEEHHIRYFPSKEDKKAYFKHIEWNPIQVLKWK